MTVAAGDRAPSFTVDTTEGTRNLEDLLQQGSLVLVFYAEDATPMCTAQVAGFRDEYETLRDLGANVLAVSADSLDSHRAFATRLGSMPFPLAADPDLSLARAYGVANEDEKRSHRAVFVIGTDGTVLQAVPFYQPGAVDQFASVFQALGLDL